jgi:hypothetical protein
VRLLSSESAHNGNKTAIHLSKHADSTYERSQPEVV